MSDVMQQNAGYGRSGRAVPTHPLANAAPVLEQALPQPRADQIPVSDGGGRRGPPNSGAFFPKPEVVSTRRLLKPRWPTTKTLLTVST
jgi:hypothetical protein